MGISGDVFEAEPHLEDDGPLAHNVALVHNLWAYGKSWYAASTVSNEDALRLDSADAQKAALKLVDRARSEAKKQSASFAKLAQWIADVADDVSLLDVEHAWCSSCFFETEHRKSNRPVGQVAVYVCQGCGAATLPCVAPGCRNMAVRDRGGVRIPRFCAEHRRDIPGFEKAQKTFGALHDYEEYLKYEKPDLARASQIVVGSAVVAGVALPLAFLAAPAIGGALGSLGMFGGYAGAAATSHGLAMLGGGTIAAGGLGMAGGTAVVTAVGGAVGGALGASVSTAYLREDKSFGIELLRPGAGGVPVLVANGFLTGGAGERWGGWKDVVDARYPDSPVYRVRWGAKELKDLGAFVGNAAASTSGTVAARAAAMHATKAGARLLGNLVGPALVAAELAKNPWHVAKSRADKTGVILGDLLARTDAESYVLVGHSLGARVMAVAAETLGTKPGGPRIQAAHLLGAAMGARGNWDALTAAVDDRVYCYFSTNDRVLNYLYRTAQAGEVAAGSSGFQPASSKIENVDVSDEVSTHSDYLTHVAMK
ncbi:DUF726 domain-containing protein [Microbacterium excoecariae]|uniref:DUF726 domain-containing protein n=1 Tax=Microbacterium excoecariae TaxID=2715210 RepID=UPI001408B609|nr:DUF726 domain-containing protein [Microbacterium excoecariae]